MRAGGFGGGEVGLGKVAGFGGQGLVQLGGALTLAVDLVVPQVAENIRHGHAAGGRLAMLTAAVTVEVRGRLAIFFELLLFTQTDRVINAGGDIFPEHIAVGHLADDGMNPLVRKDGLDRGLLLVETLADEFLQFR